MILSSLCLPHLHEGNLGGQVNILPRGIKSFDLAILWRLEAPYSTGRGSNELVLSYQEEALMSTI
jgi:hypothetical protein